VSTVESYILYEVRADNIALITLNRPATANAQDTKFLYELNDAFDRAAHDDAIKVIVLASNGKNFSSGHDLRENEYRENVLRYRTVAPLCGFASAGAEGLMAREEEIYLGFCERWRNIPKPTIVAVQGKCIGGGLMLVWPCDIIIAGEDASFADPTLSFGVPGHEFFMHVWELGARKAKEFLFTSGSLTASEAYSLGMVNKVVPPALLLEESLAMAGRIAAKPAFALKLAKKAVNACVDAQGRETAMQNAFHLHQLSHAHNLERFGVPLDPTGLPESTRKAMGVGGDAKETGQREFKR
jgi:enoyl-CoA hydratase